jgi:malic enzyme
MSIPVFHDDQHGTAIISAAAMLNAVAITGRRIQDLRVVVNGAGAAGIACGKLYVQLGVKPGNLVMVDSGGVIYRGRSAGMNPYKQALACDTAARTLAEAVAGADMLVGLSVKGAFTPQLLQADESRSPSSLPWPTRTRKSTTMKPRQHVPTPSWPPAGRIIPTRSTMCWGSPLFFVVRFGRPGH